MGIIINRNYKTLSCLFKPPYYYTFTLADSKYKIRVIVAAERQRGSSLISTFQFRTRSVNLVPVFRPSYILSKSRFVSVVLWR